MNVSNVSCFHTSTVVKLFRVFLRLESGYAFAVSRLLSPLSGYGVSLNSARTLASTPSSFAWFSSGVAM